MSILHFAWVISGMMIAYQLFFSSAEMGEKETELGLMILVIIGVSLAIDMLDTTKYLKGCNDVQGLV